MTLREYAPLPVSKIVIEEDGYIEDGLLIAAENDSPLIVFFHDRFASGYHHVYMGLVLRSFGFSVLMPTLPGFGFSKAPQDFGGKHSINTSLSLITEAKKILGHKPRMGLWGAGYGATVGAQVLLAHPHFDAAVLQSGLYDLEWAYRSLLVKEDVKEKISIATGGLDEELHARSFTKLLDASYKTPTLLLHGEEDDRAPLVQATALSQKLKSLHTPTELYTFPETNHYLGANIRDKVTVPFLRKYLVAPK
jgi:dipeptidyl aminopeptidase/acylaminoacyl peptidase